MGSDTRRSFVGRIAALTTFLSAVPKLFAQQTAPGTHLRTYPLEMHRVAEVATRTTGSTTFPARAPMTAIPRTTMSS